MSSPTVRFLPEPETIDGMAIVAREDNFFGTQWDFVIISDGRAFWINASGKKIPASGNREEI